MPFNHELDNDILANSIKERILKSYGGRLGFMQAHRLNCESIFEPM